MPIHVGGTGGIPSTGVDTGIPYNSGNSQGDFASAGSNELDPISTGDITPDSVQTVWKTIKIWKGKGFELFGIDAETFELESLTPDPDSSTYSYSLKYLYNSGNTQVRQGVMNFDLIRFNNDVMLHQTMVNKEAVRRMETYLINRYMDGPENMGEMSRAEALIWAEKYVKLGYSENGNSTILFGFFVGIAALLGITMLG